MRLPENSTAIRNHYSKILGCALTAGLGVLLLDAMIIHFDTYYYYDDIHVLYPVAVQSLSASFWPTTRPIQYFIVLAANRLYLPLWLGASLLCVLGATILSGLMCERLYERRLAKAGWWVLGVANPLLFYLVSQPDAVSQAVCNLLFVGVMFAFVSELDQLSDPPLRGWRADRVAFLLNLMAAALFFTKETGVAAAIAIPTATALTRYKARRLSPLFLCSLFLPIAAATGWILLKLKFTSLFPTGIGGGRYELTLDPINWARNLVITLAFPVTPVPSSFIEFEVLRPLWIMVAVGSFIFFIVLLFHTCRRQPRIVSTMLLIAVSCAPMILIRTDELYPSMIAPFVVSIVLLFGMSRVRRLAVVYGLLLYSASLGNSIIYCLGPDFSLLGLGRLQYSIYGKYYQVDPICRIATTAHVAWDGGVATDLPLEPGIRGRIICTP